MKKTSIIKLIIFLLAVGILLTGCSLIGSGPQAINSAKEKDPEQLKTNLVRIKAEKDGTLLEGTGFFLPNGYLVAPSHLADQADEGTIQVIYADGTVRKADFTANNVQADIALLTTNAPKVEALPISEASNVPDRTFYVIGYTKEVEEPKVKEIALKEGAPEEAKNTILSFATENEVFIPGSVIVDENAQLVGVVGADLAEENVLLALDTETVVQIADSLAEQPRKETTESGKRSNVYIDYARDVYGIDASNQYVNGKYIQGETTLSGSGCKLRIGQYYSNLIEINYAKKGSNDTVYFGPEDRSVAAAVTDQGTFVTEMNRELLLSRGGKLYLHFPDLKGTLQKIVITNVYDNNDPTTAEIPIEVISSAEELERIEKEKARKAAINAAFLNFLTEQGTYDGYNYMVSIEYGNENMPPMIFYKQTDPWSMGLNSKTSVSMAIFDKGNLIEIHSEEQFLDVFEGADPNISLSYSNGAAIEDLHTDFYKIQNDDALYVYWRPAFKSNHLDRYTFSDGKFHLIQRIEGQQWVPGNSPIDNNQNEIDAKLKNPEKYYAALSTNSRETYDPVTRQWVSYDDNDEYSALTYDDAVSILSSAS